MKESRAAGHECSKVRLEVHLPVDIIRCAY